MSGDAAAEALSMVAAVRDDPVRRLGLASRFYDDRPGCVSIRSYRRAEVAFMRWQVRRGLLGDPRWRGADLFLSLHNILPVRYPLDGVSIRDILALENYAGRLIDYGVMLPRVQALYAFAAADLGEPRLLGFVQDGLPAYAWTNDEDHPWTTTRSRALRSILTWLTSS
jgi:hypothetical protein